MYSLHMLKQKPDKLEVKTPSRLDSQLCPLKWFSSIFVRAFLVL